MEWIHAILLIGAAGLALSGLIAGKSAEAKKIIDKLVPFQAVIGVALLAVGILQMVRFGPITMFKVISPAPILGLSLVVGVFGGILLGFLFGMPQIAKWIPGDSPAEQKAQELSAKLAPYQVILGMLCGIAGIVFLLLNLGIMKPY